MDRECVTCNITNEQITKDIVPASHFITVDLTLDRRLLGHSVIDRMLRGAEMYFPLINLDNRHMDLQRLVVEAFEAADKNLNIQSAVAWGEGFRFPPEVHIRDTAELEAMDYDLTGLIRRRQALLLPNRLKKENLMGRDSENPDVILLHDLVEGIRVPVDPDFIEDRTPVPMDKNYKVAHSAIDKSWYKLYLAGFALLIVTVAMSHVARTVKLNYSPAGWHEKHGAPGGRCAIDYSRPNSHGQAFNTKRVKEIVKALYGEIDPVQIDRLMKMILEQVERVGGWASLVIWKMDLKGAFNLIFFRPEDAGLLAVELSDGLTMISLVGSFGHTGTPFCF